MSRPGIRALRHLAVVSLALSSIGASCGQSALGIMPGAINDPGNLSLRLAILSFATSNICGEMLRRSVAIRTRDEEPAMGRFFPATCFAQKLQNEHLFIQISGTGYAWTNATKRIAFQTSASIEYEQDFLMSGSTLYAYLRNKATNDVRFTLKLVESPANASMGPLGNVNAQTLAAQAGPQLMKAVLSRGFTVIRDPDGSATFGLGTVELGQRPDQPYLKANTGRQLLANERTEVHLGQRDYAGPFEITGDGHALTLTVSVDGAPNADVIVVPASIAQAWRDTYMTQAATTPPPAPGNVDETVTQGMIWRRTVALPKGSYYVVFDNTATAGRTAPLVNPNADRAATISYAVEEGGAP